MPQPRTLKKGEVIEIDGVQHRTYFNWKKAGFQVQKGSKSTKKNIAGVALFSEDQVEEIKQREEDWQEEEQRDNDFGLNHFGLNPND